MSAFTVLAFMFSFVAIWFLYKRERACYRCGGRGRHRADCPDAARRDS